MTAGSAPSPLAEIGEWCPPCGLEHQPRERLVPCSCCDLPTAAVHAICDQCKENR